MGLAGAAGGVSTGRQNTWKRIRQKWHPEQAASVLRDTQVANPQPNRHESGCARPQRAMSVRLGQEVQALPWTLTDVPATYRRSEHA